MVVDECGAHEFARNALSVPEDQRKWTGTCFGVCTLLSLVGDAMGNDGRRTDSAGTSKVSFADVDYFIYFSIRLSPQIQYSIAHFQLDFAESEEPRAGYDDTATDDDFHDIDLLSRLRFTLRLAIS